MAAGSSSGASSWRASSMIDLFGAMTSSTHDTGGGHSGGRSSGGGGGGSSSSNPLLQAATLVAAAVPRERSVSLATVWEEIAGGTDVIHLGKRTVASRAYVGAFNFKGADQQKNVGKLSGGERNRVHM
eukprot:gene20107-25504_t